MQKERRVKTSAGLVLSFLDIIWVPITRILHFLILVGYGYVIKFY